jgi:threonine/homoserine/homoserine lactone efflux protein
MGAGGVVFAAAAIAGMTAVLARAPWLFVALKAAAGAYLLLLLAWRLWRHAGDRAVRVGHGPAPAGAFAAGRAVLAAQLANPKTALGYAGVFAALLPTGVPAGDARY